MTTRAREEKIQATPETLPPKDDFRSTFYWRIFRIMAEFVDGWQFIADFKKTVTFFGSARTNEKDPWYREARELARMLANAGFTIITGGGPGIMEAANRGAVDARQRASASTVKRIGESVGLNIRLPHEQRINPFVRKAVAFHYFFVRKVMLSYYAQAYVYFPGGYGTLDEMFEIITLIQTKKVQRIPIVLVGRDYWQPLADFLTKTVHARYRAVDQSDLKLFSIVDSAAEAYKAIQKSPTREF